jgi:TPR repeat protein
MLNTDALLQIAYNAAESGDFDLARQCYERGAYFGDPQCLQALGYMHDVGEGVPENKTLAMQIYRKAWRRGSHEAAINIAILYREQGKRRLAFQWFERVAIAGDGSARLEMAKSFLSGFGVSRNSQSALRCLQLAIQSEYITEYERKEAGALLAALRLKSA